MHYLYITPFFPSDRSWRGGFCLDAVKALKRDGRYNVIVMTATECGGDYEYQGVKVYQIPRIRLGASEYFEALLEPANNFLFLKKLQSIGVRLSDVAVCHVHDYEHYIPYAMAIKTRNSHVLTLVHHHWSGRNKIRFGKLGCLPLLGELQYMHRRSLFNRVDAHVFCSEESRHQFAKNVDFDVVPAVARPMTEQLRWGRRLKLPVYRDSYVLYNGVDKTLFYPADKSHAGYMIGCVGNFNPGKCQDVLIRAFAKVAAANGSARLVFVGSGPKRGECERLAAELHISDRVIFKNEMPHGELGDYYRELDLFVLPSVNEGFCCVFVEANACGVPVIGCNNISLKEVLSGGSNSRWLIPPYDENTLAQKILSFGENRDRQSFVVDLDINSLYQKFLDWVDSRRT